MSDRLHTVLALALVALVPFAPLGMWAYAKLASADRTHARAAAEQVFASAPPPAGASRDGTSEYADRSWEGENLVPISGWTFETAYRLPRAEKPDRIARHYRRLLQGWSVHKDVVGCDTLSVPSGCTAFYLTFSRGSTKLVLNLAEYVNTDGRTFNEYGASVSQ